jgi:hypothetical protein
MPEYRANLSSAVFPMTLADAGRTVIFPQADQNFDRRVDPAGEQKDAGIPQAMYLENVIPTVNGYQSVGYRARNALPPRNSGTGSLIPRQAFFVDDTIMIARDGSFSYQDVITNNISCSLPWKYQIGPAPASGAVHSIAKVRGVNYWCDRVSLFTFTIDPGTKQSTFVDISGSVTGITVSQIRAICSSYNYLVALMDDDTIAWSSTTTPTDFTVSLVTGAGSQVPSNAQNANFLIEHPEGFFIYCDNSAVFAKYTGNSRYPWKFTPVANAGGYSTLNQIYGSAQTPEHYGIDNSNKLQIITPDRAQLVAPEVTTFLERKNYKDTFDYLDNTFGRQINLVSTHIYYLLDRYVVVSTQFGSETQFTHAFVYDVLLQRYGILKVSHAYVFADATTLTFVPKFAGERPQTWSLNIYDPNSIFQGVLLLGKFQYIRDRWIQLEGIEIESAQDTDRVIRNFSLLLFQSRDGKNFLPPVTIPTSGTGNLITAPTHKTAKSHSIMLKGAFDVNTLQLDFRIAGD